MAFVQSLLCASHGALLWRLDEEMLFSCHCFPCLNDWDYDIFIKREQTKHLYCCVYVSVGIKLKYHGFLSKCEDKEVFLLMKST